MSTTAPYYCPVCGGTDCNDQIAKVPFGMATRPSTSGMKRSGRFFTTTDRVWRNGRLVVGRNQQIPWETAVALGLVEAEMVATPLTEAAANPAPPPTTEEPTGEDEDDKPEAASAPEQQQAIVRRSSRAGKAPAKKARAAKKAAPRKDTSE